MHTPHDGGSSPRGLLSLLPSIALLIVAGAAISSAYNLVHPKGIFRTPPAFVDSARATAAVPPPEAKPGVASPGQPPPSTDAARLHPAAADAPDPVSPAARPKAADATTAKRSDPATPRATTRATTRAAAPKDTATAKAPPAAATVPPAAPAYPPATSPASNLRGLVQVEPEEAYASFRQHNAIYVDARAAERYELGHIPGALDLPISDFATAFPKVEARLPRDARLIVYCESTDCDEAETLSWELVHRGYSGVLYYKKGWEAWDKAGYPQETGAPAAR